jgi:pyroglutamyl-peptidase
MSLMDVPADRRPTIFLTGFGPFPGVAENASGALVKALARTARRTMPEYRFVTAILPTEWGRVPRLIAGLHARHAPVLALHFGVAAGAEVFRLETEARNFCRAALDAAGTGPLFDCLVVEGAATLATTIPTAAIAAKLGAEGYPVSLSDDAGGYLCNALLYHSLDIARRARGGCRVGFIHIPADLASAFPERQKAVSGALAILKSALEACAKPPVLHGRRPKLIAD